MRFLLGLALVVPAAAGAVELEGVVAVTGGGASHPWLEPGPQQPEVMGGAQLRLALRSRWESMRLHALWEGRATRFALSELTAFDHRLVLSCGGALGGPMEGDVELMAAQTRFGTTASIDPGEAALPIEVAWSDAVGAGLALALRGPGRSLGVGWQSLLRNNSVRFAGSQDTSSFLEQVHRLRVALGVQPHRRLELRAALIGELRRTGEPVFSYDGAGVALSTTVQPWPGGRVEAALRVQHNHFAARTDLYARLSLDLAQRLARGLRVGVSWALANNGSDDAAYDAARHVLLVWVEAQRVW